MLTYSLNYTSFNMEPLLRKSWIFLFVSFLLTAHDSISQLPVVSFEIITSREGLPSNDVLSASRDKTGFIWFGTRQCPVRYDGVNFKSFTSFTTNFINGIAADQHNNIWFSSDRSGVSKIHSTTMEMERIFFDSGKASTGYFYFDRFGMGWYSDHYGINQLNLISNKKKHYPLKRTTYVGPKAAFVEDHDSTLWVIGKDNGLFRYDRRGDSLISVLRPESSTTGHVDALLMSQGLADGEGILWLGTYNLGLIRYDPKKKELKTFDTGRIANQVVSLAEGVDENGKRIFWVGDEQGLGIFRPDQGKFYFFTDILPKAFSVNYIYRNTTDGVVWFCTSNGVIKYHPQSNMIQGITFPEVLLSNKLSVNVIHQDQREGYQHMFYLGLSNSVLLRWNRKLNQFTKVEYAADAAETKWIRQRDDETLWIGTNRWDYVRPGIFVYDLKKEKFIGPARIKEVNQFFSVPFFMYGVFDNHNQLIVGNSDEGLHIVEEQSGKEVTPWPADSMKNLVKNNNLINHILVGSHDKLWLGTYRGVFFYDPAKKQFVCADPKRLPDSMDDSAVNTVLEDRHGNIWAARWGSLTSMSKTGELTTVLTPKDGFVDRQIRGLAEDHNGNIWIGNYEGLYCYNPDTKRLTRFTMNDGLLSNKTIECLAISQDRKELFVGHVNGFNVVKVDQVLNTFKVPPLVFNTFKIHEQERLVDFSKPLQLKPTEKVFSVDFVALNYRKADDNQYAYYLEGFEKEWNYSGSKHTAYYTNLNPGDYTLHVKAGDAFGNWNKEELTMNVEVLPAFYQTVWFKILLSLLIAGLLYGVYQYRINQLLQLQQVRNRISADLHDELGSTLSGISIMGSLAKNELTSQDAPSTFVDRIMEDVRQMSSSLDDIVWNISPKNDALSSLVARMTRYASELFEAKQINFTLKVPDQLNDVKLSMDQRRNIYLIFKESVNNLVKYSKCQHAAVIIEMDKRHFHLVIQDDGIGFNPQALTDRNGIRNLRARAQTLKGKLDIESVLGKGTAIRLDFPIDA